MWLILIIFIRKNGEKITKISCIFSFSRRKNSPSKIKKFTKRKKNWSKNPLIFFLEKEGGGEGMGARYQCFFPA